MILTPVSLTLKMMLSYSFWQFSFRMVCKNNNSLTYSKLMKSKYIQTTTLLLLLSNIFNVIARFEKQWLRNPKSRPQIITRSKNLFHLKQLYTLYDKF